MDLISQGFLLIQQGRFRELVTKVRIILISGRKSSFPIQKRQHSTSAVQILSSPHTLFLANQISETLSELDLDSEIISDPKQLEKNPFFTVVLSPAYFNFPKTSTPRIVFQLEQTTSNRWFSSEMVTYLKNSQAVFEYSSQNIDQILKLGIEFEKLFYVPIGGSTKVLSESLRDRETLVDGKSTTRATLVYGDFSSSQRRASFLAQAKEKIDDLQFIDKKFGSDVWRILSRSSVVVNVNYYSPAVLATPRLWEALSFGNLVISEKATNWQEYPEFEGLINFFEEGDFTGIIEAANNVPALESPDWKHRVSQIAKSEQRFKHMFTRGLFGLNLIPEQSFLKYINFEGVSKDTPIVISLPETTHRRKALEDKSTPQVSIFDGIKLTPGWVGCATTYRMISKSLVGNGVRKAIICEDDVLLPPNYNEEISRILRYLDRPGLEWDLFVGLISDFDPDTVISSVETFEGKNFLEIDRFTSMVFNIYNMEALKLMADWEIDQNLSIKENTIDRYISMKKHLKVICLEFDVFGHDSDQFSTLWGFKNTQYETLILQSQEIKSKLVKDFLGKPNASKRNKEPRSS